MLALWTLNPAIDFQIRMKVLKDALAERSEAVAQGAIPKGRGFEPHRCHFCGMGCDHMCMYMCMMYLITDFHFHLTIFEAYQTHRERTRYSYEKQLNHNIILDPRFTLADDTLAEQLRRRPATPMGSPVRAHVRLGLEDSQRLK